MNYNTKSDNSMCCEQSVCPEYSVIFLLDEEHPEFPQFIQDVYSLFSSRNLSFEIILMVNGVDGFLTDKICQMGMDLHKIKVLFISKKSPQSTCIRAGVKQSCGNTILVCGSYMQISIDDIGNLLDAFGSDTDLITPWRKKRVDPGINQFQSRVFNWIVQKIFGIQIHDLSCTVKIFRREVVEQTPLYGNMYRFLPLVASKKGYRIKEVSCSHNKEYGKTGLYSLSEYFSRVIDVFTMLFIMGYTRKPLRFFSFIGITVFIFGLFICGIVIWQKIVSGQPIGDRSLLLLGVIVMVLGVQAWSSGLLGEIITFTCGRSKQDYCIDTTTDDL
ncbi:hypothetical protein [Desulfovermiculus halophilus]|uniref:hypothetical protein n=1 Tax=Desulfovermiculus halophilus TaxID=339722 RepID=UPI0012947E4E|nr:hypothetical protein [Desulfovermiculus halophilus]